MQVRCPHCQTPVDLSSDGQLSDIACPSCGSSFSLLGTAETARYEVSTKTIGHFELVDRIGVGTFGFVWKARDTELDRTVAIKIPRKGQLEPGETEQFLREARAAAQVRHPNIVSVHEVGREQNTVFIVSDFVEGATLADRLTVQRFSCREATELCVKIADALHHAHESGVIHRDLKPGNIILDTDGEPHIMDFGLARREAGEVTMTVEGRMLGTPAYMSPEQAKGSAHTADRRSDVYSLGVILFELLTGERPFRGNVRMLVNQVISDEPPSPRRLNGAVPRDLETICLKCLEKELRKRYESAEELADDLRRFLAGDPIRARPIARLERAWRWCRRNPVVSTLATGLVLSLLGGLTGVTIQWLRAVEARVESDVARKESEAARAESDRANAALEEQAYGLRMSAAFQAWEIGNRDRVQQLLRECGPQHGRPDLRGFEWRLLRGLAQENSLAATLSFDSVVNSFTYSTNGRYWAAALGNGEVKVHDLTSGQESTLAAAAPESGMWRTARVIVFSPDSNMLAAAGGDAQDIVRLWELPSFEEIAVPVRHKAPIRAVAVSPDGKVGASVDLNGTVQVWSIPDGTSRWSVETLGDCSVVAFSPDADSRLLIISSWGGEVSFWDSVTGESHADRNLDLGPTVVAIAFSPDGKRLAIGGDVGLCLWDMTSGKPLERTRLTYERCEWIAFSPDGNFIAAQDAYHESAALWDVRNGHKAMRFLNAQPLAFSSDGQLLACRSGDQTVNCWDLDANDARLFKADPTDWFPLATSPDTKTVATSRNNSTVLWNPATRSVQILGEHSGWIQGVAYSPDCNMLASGDTEGQIKLWDIGDSKLIFSWEGHKSTGICGVSALSFSRDGKKLASGGPNGEIKLWDLESHRGQSLVGLQGQVLGLAFSPDHKYLASGGSTGGGAIVWDILSPVPKVVVALRDQLYPRALAFSADSTMLAVSGARNTDFIYETQTWQKLQELPSNARFNSDVVFSRDGKTLVTATPGGEVNFWQVTTGYAVGTLRMNEKVRKLAFLDDNTLVTASMEGFVRVWRAAPFDSTQDK